MNLVNKNRINDTSAVRMPIKEAPIDSTRPILLITMLFIVAFSFNQSFLSFQRVIRPTVVV